MKNFSGIRFIHVDVVKYNPGIWKPQFHCSHFLSSLSTGKNRQIFKPGSSAFFGDCFIRVLIWFLQRINQRKERMRRGRRWEGERMRRGWRWEIERVERTDFMKKGGEGGDQCFLGSKEVSFLIKVLHIMFVDCILYKSINKMSIETDHQIMILKGGKTKHSFLLLKVTVQKKEIS